MKSLHKILLLALMLVISSSVVLGTNTSTIMGDTECPDESIPQVLMFAFIGTFMLAMLWFSEKIIRIPFFTILIGIGMLFYSFSLYSCHDILGYITTAFAVGIMLFKVFWK